MFVLFRLSGVLGLGVYVCFLVLPVSRILGLVFFCFFFLFVGFGMDLMVLLVGLEAGSWVSAAFLQDASSPTMKACVFLSSRDLVRCLSASGVQRGFARGSIRVSTPSPEA